MKQFKVSITGELILPFEDKKDIGIISQNLALLIAAMFRGHWEVECIQELQPQEGANDE